MGIGFSFLVSRFWFFRSTFQVNTIKLSNGAKASDSKEKTYSPMESEALAPKKEQKFLTLWH